MLQQHTLSELQSFNRTQLWQLCRERGLKCYPKTADCVEAICRAQEPIEKVASTIVFPGEPCRSLLLDMPRVSEPTITVNDAELQTETEITTVEISEYDHEIYAAGKQIALITHDPDDFQTQRWVVMIGETEIHRADSWASCHSHIAWHYKQGTLPTALPVAEKLESGLQVQNQVSQTAPEIEIDSDIDADFGTLYRVWNERTLLGTFYCAADEKWVAMPCNSDDRPRCNTAAEAQLIIVAMAGLHASDSTDEEVDLLDKPFDELTVAEWQTIKQQALQAELVAA